MTFLPVFGSRSHPPVAVFADGHDEQSLASHGVTSAGRAEYSCRNAVAQPFQCWDDGCKLSVRVPRDVLAEDKIRPALFGETADLGREEPLSICSCALSGDGVVLAGVSRSEDVYEATPRSSVESEHVRPDRCRMKPPCFHRRDQACGGCGFPLHVQDAPASLSPILESEQDSEFKASDACAEGEDIPGTYSHTVKPPHQSAVQRVMRERSGSEPLRA
jgi:hypothetical protein